MRKEQVIYILSQLLILLCGRLGDVGEHCDGDCQQKAAKLNQKNALEADDLHHCPCFKHKINKNVQRESHAHTHTHMHTHMHTHTHKHKHMHTHAALALML